MENGISNCILSITAVVTTLTTIILAYFNHKYLRLTESMLDSQSDPYITFTVARDVHREDQLLLIIQNIGTGIAYNLQFNLSQEIPFPKLENQINAKKIFTNGIACISPNEKIIFDWGSFRELINKFSDPIKVICDFNKNNGKNFSSTSFIGLDAIKCEPTYSVYSDIAKSVKCISEKQ
ncbi:MAG: hypothetical protein WC627_03460 [Legionella sp.]|jgi:hypothetical protein